jgi:hypothetical protein
MTVAHYTSLHPPWEPLTLVLTAGAIWLTACGVRLSTKAVGLAVLMQVAIMLIVCSDHAHRLQRCPRRPACPSLGYTVLLDTPNLWSGLRVGRVPARPLHVHWMGERSSARRGVPRSEAPFREPSTCRSRSPRPCSSLLRRRGSRFRRLPVCAIADAWAMFIAGARARRSHRAHLKSRLIPRHRSESCRSLLTPTYFSATAFGLRAAGRTTVTV